MKFSIIYITIIFYIGYINPAAIYSNDRSINTKAIKRNDKFNTFESSLSYIYEKRDQNENESGSSEKVHGFGDNSDDDEHTEDWLVKSNNFLL